ncbi:MAG: transglutaminase family protein [Aeromicrobium sp.]|uniref:transglutaminase-like domain-containing protein n=1 Tax=Aeromicrobium sp. TaxID=1871063 RepID=UPI0039E49CA9
MVALTRELRGGAASDEEFARAAFEWVRDEVAHSFDAGDTRVMLTAAETLEHGVGLCHAASHLLVAVSRVGVA